MGASETRARRSRANGRASRAAILDAAAQVAGERGYEGTTIKLVSERSGLPASSIYWHFANKDALIAAIIERSHHDWVDATTTFDIDESVDADEAFVAELRNAGEQTAKFPDFLRLGLMLTLEQRPEEPEGRREFLTGRRETRARIIGAYQHAFPDLDADAVGRLATLTLAGSDGIFIAAQADDIDITEQFETLGHAILGAAARFRADKIRR